MTASIWQPNGFAPTVVPLAYFEGVATSGQTVISIAPYTAISDSQLQVFVGGQLLNTPAWSVVGSTVVLSSGMTLGQTYRVDVYAATPVSDTELPPQTGHANEALFTDGTDPYWGAIPNPLPSQAGNAGKGLFTNGTTGFWAESDVIVSNISELKTLSKTLYRTAVVKGYTVQGDGGGGTYYYDSSDTISADNGGTIIVAGDGGRWKLLFVDLVSVLQFGADNTGVTDTTARMQAALNACANVLIPAGTYKVFPITVPSNRRIVFHAAAILSAAPGYGANDRLFNINGVSNVTVYGNGATVQMAKPEYVTGEQRHAVFIINSSDVKIYDLLAQNSGGDGFYIGSTYGVANTYPKRISLIGCRAVNNKRQGLSIVAGDTINIVNCVFESTTGTPPAYGIDIEPDNSLDTLRAINILNCTTRNNYGGGIIIALQFLSSTAANDLSITITNWLSDGDGAVAANTANAALRVTGNGTGAWLNNLRGIIKISGFEIRNPVSSGIWNTYWPANYTPSLIIEDGVIINPGSGSPANDEDKCGIVIWGYNLGAQDFGNIEINRVKVRDTRGVAATYSPVYLYKTIGASGVGQARNVRLKDVTGDGFTPLSGRGHLLSLVDMDESSVSYTMEQTVTNIANSVDVTRGYAGYTIICTVSRIVTMPKAATNRGLMYRHINLATGQAYQIRPTAGDILDYTASNSNVDLVLARFGAFVEYLAVDNNSYRAVAIHDWAKRPGPQQAAETTTPASQVFWVTAMPTSGFFARGDIAWNLNFSIGVTPFWARLTTGTGHVLNTDWRAAPVL